MANDKTFPEVKTNPLTEAAKKRLSRSMMFVPGNTPKMINSADTVSYTHLTLPTNREV